MIPAFSACTESPEPGCSASTTVSAIESTPTSLCPVPDRLEEDDVLAGRVEQEQRLERRLGEAAGVAARAHRADEDARVEEVVGEPDPVAEQRALRERARRVDRDDADRLPERAHVGDERRDQARLADAGRAGDADRVRAAGLRVQLAHERVRGRIAVLDERDRPRERARVARANALDQTLAGPRAAGHAACATAWTFSAPRRSSPRHARRRRAPRTAAIA